MRKPPRDTEVDGVPLELEREDTGRMVADFLAAVREAGNMDPRRPKSEPDWGEEQLERLSERMVARVANPKGQRTFLGVPSGNWLKFVAAVVTAAGTAYAGIKVAIQDNTAAIEQHRQSRGHPGVLGDLKEVDVRLHGIERKQDVQDVKQEQTLDGIKQIQDELKDQRRRGR